MVDAGQLVERRGRRRRRQRRGGKSYFAQGRALVVEGPEGPRWNSIGASSGIG